MKIKGNFVSFMTTKQSMRLLLLLFLFSYTNFLSAQTNSVDVATKTAEGFCTCVNANYKIDEDIKDILLKIIEFSNKNDQEGYTAYYNSLSTEIRDRSEKQLTSMMDNQISFNECMKTHTAALKDAGSDIQKMKMEVLLKMKNMAGCKFAAKLMELGD